VTSTHIGIVSLQSSSFSAAAAEETTLKTIMVAESGNKQRRSLQSQRKGRADEGMSPHACQLPNQLQLRLLRNRRNLSLAGTTLSEAAASSRIRLRQILHPLHPTKKDGPRGRLLQRTVKFSPACPELSVMESLPQSSKQTDSVPHPQQGQNPLKVIADHL
jgi:hypothetical protein